MHHGENRAAEQKTVNSAKKSIGGSLNFAGKHRAKFFNLVEIGGLCNMHNWLKGLWTPLAGSIYIKAMKQCEGGERPGPSFDQHVLSHFSPLKNRVFTTCALELITSFYP